MPDAPPGDWRSKRRGPRIPSAAQIEAGFEAVHAGKLSRLALPSLLTKHATYVTAHTALWHHGMIEQVPTAIYAATTGEAATFQTPFGPVHLHQIAPELFGGWGTNEDCPGAQIATAEKALTDYFYMANSRDPAFGKLPEVEVPPGFSWKAAHGFADLIANPVWKKTVHTRLTQQEKECCLLAAHDSAEA